MSIDKKRGSEEIRAFLETYRDPDNIGYKSNLLPDYDVDRILGIRSPFLKSVATQMIKRGDAQAFIADLPHKYLEEDLLHAYIISNVEDFQDLILKLNAFLPYVDNWMVTDAISPRIFSSQKVRLLPYIDAWLFSIYPYKVRFGIRMLMDNYLDKSFDPQTIQRVATIISDYYYVKMAQAWFFAEALIKRWDESIEYIEKRKLPAEVHNMAIQKGTDSYRLSDKNKDYLRKLRIKKAKNKLEDPIQEYSYLEKKDLIEDEAYRKRRN